MKCVYAQKNPQSVQVFIEPELAHGSSALMARGIYQLAGCAASVGHGRDLAKRHRRCLRHRKSDANLM